MKYLIKYRIPTVIGWVLPFILAFMVMRRLSFNFLVEAVLFVFLSLVFLFSEVLVAMKVAGVWNDWQRKKSNRDSEEK